MSASGCFHSPACQTGRGTVARAWQPLCLQRGRNKKGCKKGRPWKPKGTRDFCPAVHHATGHQEAPRGVSEALECTSHSQGAALPRTQHGSHARASGPSRSVWRALRPSLWACSFSFLRGQVEACHLTDARRGQGGLGGSGRWAISASNKAKPLWLLEKHPQAL